MWMLFYTAKILRIFQEWWLENVGALEVLSTASNTIRRTIHFRYATLWVMSDSWLYLSDKICNTTTRTIHLGLMYDYTNNREPLAT